VSAGESVNPLERAVAQALVAAGRLQGAEAPQLLAFAQTHQLVYRGSYLCGAMIRSGRLRRDEADQVLAQIPAPAPEIPTGGTLRMPAGSLPLPLPGQEGGDEAATKRHDSARLARELAAAEADGRGTMAFPAGAAAALSSGAHQAPTIRTGPQSGVHPAPQSGVYPAPQSGVYPAPQSGVYPAPQSGVYPAPQSGVYPAPQSGVYPAPQSGVYPAPQSGVYPGPPPSGVHPAPPSDRQAGRLVRSDLLDDGEATIAFGALQVPGPQGLPSSGDAYARPGDMTPGSGTPGSGVFGAPAGHTPSGTFGGHPGGRLEAPSGAFGGSPGGGFGDSPGGGFGGTPAGGVGAHPSGSFGAQPSGRLGAPMSGTYGGQSSGTSGSSSASGGLELNLEQLGLAGERYVLEKRPAPGYWEATDQHLERKVVLRVAEGGEIADDPFWRHARVLALLDQSSVREVHDLGVLPGRGPFYCLDPIEGVSLEELISSDRCPPLPALLRALIAVCASLQHAHEHDLVHVRLTPSLVRLGGHGQVYVAGWETAAFLPSAKPEVRRRVGDPPPIDPSELQSLAPELRKDSPRLSARTDVHALGRILYWILAGRSPQATSAKALQAPLRRAGAPRELIAVARKALSGTSRERYPGARHFADDLRRFLDGKAVLAERDAPLQAAIRLARRFPVVAAVGALVSAVILCGALVTYSAVRARADSAQDAKAHAALAAKEAHLRRGEAEAQLALAKERADAGKLVRRFELTLRRARGGGQDGVVAYAEAEDVVEALEARSGARTPPSKDESPAEATPRDGAAELARSLRLRLLLARGRDQLYTLDDPRPSRALDDFEAVVALEPQDPRGHFLVFEAARRLPGAAAAGKELEALRRLERLGGAWGQLASVGPDLAEVEELALELIARNPPEILGDVPEVRSLRKRLDRLCGELSDVSQARTWRGRLGVALSGPNVPRSVPVLRDGVKTKAGGGRVREVWTDLFWAILLDPTDPEPRAAYTFSFFTKWGSHTIDRYKGGWPLGSLAAICRRAERPGPSLALTDLLVRIGRVESTLPLLERALALPDPQPPRDSSVRPRLQLALARAKLKRGQPQSTSLSRLSLPPGYSAQVEALECWTALANNRPQEAFDYLGRVLTRLQRPGVRDPLLVIEDLAFALSDSRADARQVAATLGRMVPPAPTEQPLGKLEGALRLGLVAQLSRIPEREATLLAFEEIKRLKAHFNSSLGQSGNPRLFYNLISLHEARLWFNAQPSSPTAHLIGVSVWASLCRGEESSESVAGPVRDLLVERLKRLGRPKAARAFAIEDPVTEFVIPRAYTAPEVWDWKGRRSTTGEVPR